MVQAYVYMKMSEYPLWVQSPWPVKNQYEIKSKVYAHNPEETSTAIQGNSNYAAYISSLIQSTK